MSGFVVFFIAFSSTLSAEYVDNLKDEGRVCGIIDRLLNYLENKGSTEEICRVYLRRIMHTYYKFDYKAHRRSLGLQGESKVRKTFPTRTQNIFLVLRLFQISKLTRVTEIRTP